MTRTLEVGQFLAGSPLAWLVLTMLVFLGARWMFDQTGRFALANPVLISVAAIISVLLLTGVSYEQYFRGGQLLHFFLGPATVALAVPLHANLHRVKSLLLPLLVSLVGGSALSIASVVLIAKILGAPALLQISLAPKSATMPVAMSIAEHAGGSASLTAAFVILSGISGAVLGPVFLRRLRIHDHAAIGFAIGTASHGIGTARAFQISHIAGAFAGLAMGLNALATSLLVPALLRLLGL